jgi:hypothetical protein
MTENTRLILPASWATYAYYGNPDGYGWMELQDIEATLQYHGVRAGDCFSVEEYGVTADHDIPNGCRQPYGYADCAVYLF